MQRPDAAAWVGDEIVTRAEVATEVARLRAGPAGTRLPPEGTAEARQLQRWVAQRVVLRRLLERELRTLGPGPCAGPGLPSAPDPALLGSAAADVLAGSPAARAVFAAVTADVPVPEDQIRAYYAGNPDRFRQPERWTLRHAFDPSTPAPLASRLRRAPLVIATPQSLPAPVTAAARAAGLPPATAGPVRTLLGWHLVAIDAIHPPAVLPYPAAHDQIATHLLDRARQRTFARWLDTHCATLVQLAPGYEHPADPRQPDATHRH